MHIMTNSPLDADKKLAEDHVKWYMGLLRSQFLAWLDITEKLMIENFTHGIKHGRELERETKMETDRNNAD